MIDFQLIIPMSGTGQRFKDAGYKNLKPLIEVNNQTLLEHVVGMFPKVQDVLFIIANQEPQRKELIQRIKTSFPQAKIAEIDTHKFGPSYALHEVKPYISDDKKIIICYCDFHAVWNPGEMLEQLETMDGSILTYTGFHPHMLRNDKYAYVRKNLDFVLEIQEKNPFTDSPMSEEASAGCYGFASKDILLSAIEYQIKHDLSFNGEFYTSLTYKPLIDNGLNIGTVLATKFSQWGTPEDLADWLYWDACRSHEVHTCQECTDRSPIEMTSIVLAAGAGRRVVEKTGVTKPNIQVGELLLWEYSYLLSMRGSTILVAHKDNQVDVSQAPKVKFAEISFRTEGQAITAKLGLELIANGDKSPVHVLSSDNIMCAKAVVDALQEVASADLVVWTVAGYPPAQYSPENYSWLKVDGKEKIVGIHGKEAPFNSRTAHLIIGNFTFKNVDTALMLISQLEDREIRINNEFYLDSVIMLALENNLIVSHIDVSNFLAIGTENELKIHEYYWT